MTIRAVNLKPGDYFSFIPAEWYGPSTLISNTRTGVAYVDPSLSVRLLLKKQR